MPAAVESGVFNVERGVPWHGLGYANQGYLYASNVLKYAGLDWEVEKVPLFVADPTAVYAQDEYIEVPDHFGIVRDRDNAVLGVVGNRYEPIQNEAVLSFMDNLVGTGQAIYDAAWSLRGGKTVAITAELDNSTIRMPEGEEFRTYLTASNNHDGSGKVKIFTTPIRVVCMNTLAMALKGAKYTWERKHTINAMSPAAIAEAREALELATLYNQYLADEANRLVNEAFSKVEFTDMAHWLTIGELKHDEKPSPQSVTKFENMMSLYVNSDNLGNIRGTKWGALNAVAEYVDYASNYRGENKLDKRAESILLGRGVDLKTKAYDYLVAA